MLGDKPSYLYGQYVTLKPISSALHGYELYTNLNHPHLWDFFYSRPYESYTDFSRYVRGLERQVDREIQNYAVCNAATGEPLGFLGIDEKELIDHETVEIVNVMFSPKLQKTTMATQAFYLVAKHCFEILSCDRLEWRCDLSNQNSFRAAGRLGFYYIGVEPDRYTQHEYNFFSMIKGEWLERIKGEYARWLDPANFEKDGSQKTKLQLRVE